jgi:HK97 family phage portal protein
VLLSQGDVATVNAAPTSTSSLLDGSPGGGVDGPELWGAWAAYGQLYRSQPWVYTLVRKLGVSTGRIPVKVHRREDNGARTSARETRYSQVLRQPNRRMGPKRLWLWTGSTCELYGEALWVKLRDDTDLVRELYPVHPTHLSRIYTDSNGQRWYLLFGGRLPVRAEDVVHFASYNPDSLVRGLSPCEPLRRTLEAEDAARRASSAMWRQGARPALVLTHPKTVSDAAAKRLLKTFDSKHGGVDNWSKTALLEEGVTPHQLQLSHEDMQYVDGRRLNREECCAVWDVPPPVVHILDRATFSNITEQMRSMYRDTMAPRFNFYEDALSTQLAPDFLRFDGADLYSEFLLDEVLRGDTETRTKGYAQAIGTAQMTPNEGRRLENRPDIEGGDELLVNAALIPLSSAIAAATQTAATVRSIKGVTAEHGRLITGRLRRAGSWDDVDDDRVLAGVDGDTSTIRGLLVAGRMRGTDLTTIRRQVTAQLEQLQPLDDDKPDTVEAS